MEFPNAVKWAVLNRLVTIGAMIGGIGLVVVGFVLGFADAIEALLNLDWQDPDFAAVAEAANPMIALAFAVLGFVVWQVGKTYALFRTLPRASGRAAARQFDHQQVKSEVLDGLDDRLTNIEEELEETRRGVQELKREEHADAFDPGVDLGSPSASEEGEADPASTYESPTDAETAAPGVDGEDRTATTAGPGDEDEFTFGEDGSAPEPDADRTGTTVDEGIAGEPADVGDEPAGGITDEPAGGITDEPIDDSVVDEDERDGDRSADENTADSENDPFA